MNLRDFNFNFKPKNRIRLIINNKKNLDFKVLKFDFREYENELYNLLVRIYGSCMFIDKIEISIFSSVTTISVNCYNIDYNNILSFVYGKGCY